MKSALSERMSIIPFQLSALSIRTNGLCLLLAVASAAGLGCSAEAEERGGGRNSLEHCFSPTQNLEHAYDDGAKGCACKDEPDQCVDGVALLCDGGAWQAVEDGPCMR
jgi:hypothetical protein